MLFFTGISRFASSIAGKKIENIPKKKYELALMREMVEEAISIITSGKNICEFGQLLNESWKLKRTLTDNITNSFIDNIYDNAMETGALGGKILGAGGGGFMLIFAKPQDQTRIKKRLKKFLCVPFDFEKHGSQVVVFQPESSDFNYPNHGCL